MVQELGGYDDYADREREALAQLNAPQPQPTYAPPTPGYSDPTMGQNQEMMAAQDLYGQQNRAAYQQFSDQNIYQGNLDAQNSFLPQEYQSTLRSGLPSGFEDYSGIRAGSSAFGGELGRFASPVLGPLGEAAGRAFDAGSAGMVSRGLDYLGLPTAPQLGRAVGEGIGPAIGSLPGQSLPTGENWADVAALGFGVPGVPSLLGEAAGPLIRGGLETAGPLLKSIIPETKFGEQPFFANAASGGRLNPDSAEFLAAQRAEMQRMGGNPFETVARPGYGELPQPTAHDIGRQTIRESAFGDQGGVPLPGTRPAAPAGMPEPQPINPFGSPANMANMGHPVGVEPTLPSTFRPEVPPVLPELPPLRAMPNIPPMADVNSALESRLGAMAESRPPSILIPQEAASIRRPVEGAVQGEGFTMEPGQFNPVPNPTGRGLDTSAANTGQFYGPGTPNATGANPISGFGPPTPPRGLYGSWEGSSLPPLASASDVHATLLDYLNLPRSLMAGADMSYALRQMGLLAPSHLPEFLGAVGKGLRAAIDPEYAALIEKQIAESPFAHLKGNLYQAPTGNAGTLLSREENYAAMPALENLGPVGRFVRGLYEPLERGNTTMINKFRSDVADNFITTTMRNNGITDPEMVSGKIAQDIFRYNNFITRATGRGTLGSMEQAALPLGQIFFSARSAIAKPQALGYLLSKPGSPVWNQVARDFAGFLGTGTATLALADQAGLKVGLDPRSSEFGKIMVGDNHIDIWGGWQQMARAIYQEAQAARGEKNAISSTGRTYDRGALQVAADFLRNKASPPVGAALDVAFPNGYRDAPGLNTSTAFNYLAPLWLQSVGQALVHDGVKGALIDASLGFFGVGTQTYGASPQSSIGAANTAVKSAVTAATTDSEALSRAFPNNPQLVQALNGVPWADLEPKEKDALKGVIDPKLLATLESEKGKLGGVIYDTGKKLEELDSRIDSRRTEWQQARQIISDRIEKGQGDAYQLRAGLTQLKSEEKKEIDGLYAERKTISSDKAYRDALSALPAQPKQSMDDKLQEFKSIQDLPSVKRTDGSLDYKRIDAIQAAYLSELQKSDPKAAARLDYLTERADRRTPVEQFIDEVVRPVADVYFNLPDGTKTQWLRDHPTEEGKLWAGGYLPAVHSPEAARYGSLVMPGRPPAEVRR